MNVLEFCDPSVTESYPCLSSQLVKERSNISFSAERDGLRVQFLPDVIRDVDSGIKGAQKCVTLLFLNLLLCSNDA